MTTNGILLPPEFYQLLTLTLAERLEVRELRSGGKITKERRVRAKQDALVDAERAIRAAVDTLNTLTAPEIEDLKTTSRPTLDDLLLVAARS